MRKINKLIIFLFVIAIFLGSYIAISPIIGSEWVNYKEKQTAFPTNGDYWNSELELRLCFSNYEISVEYSNGTSELVDIHPAGRINNRGGTLNAWYSWNQEKDEICLEFLSFPYRYSESVEYIFVKKSISFIFSLLLHPQFFRQF